MPTVHGTLTFDSTTGASNFVPDPPVSPPPPPPAPPPPPPPAFVLGQVPFKAASLWNRPVPAGATYTTLAWPAVHLWQTSPPMATNYGAAWDSYSPAVYVAQPSDPIVRVSHPATWGRPAGTESIRMPAAAVGAQGTDGELVVIDGTTVHSFWQFSRTGSTASCAAWAKCDVLADDGFGWTNPVVGAGTSAIGSSMFAGLIVKAETDAGPIKHALGLRMGAPLLKPGIVPPGVASDGGSPSGIAQEGQLLAIPPTMTMPIGLSPLGQQVFAAMQTYGAYPYDRTNSDAYGGTNGPRVQANGYDDATITALDVDLPRIIPLLKRVG